MNDYDSKSYHINDQFVINFEYEFKDIASIEKFQKQEQTNSKIWINKQRIIGNKLADESKSFDDILFVDMVDIYRNLPHKLLLYFQQ